MQLTAPTTPALGELAQQLQARATTMHARVDQQQTISFDAYGDDREDLFAHARSGLHTLRNLQAAHNGALDAYTGVRFGGLDSAAVATAYESLETLKRHYDSVTRSGEYHRFPSIGDVRRDDFNSDTRFESIQALSAGSSKSLADAIGEVGTEFAAITAVSADPGARVTRRGASDEQLVDKADHLSSLATSFGEDATRIGGVAIDGRRWQTGAFDAIASIGSTLTTMTAGADHVRKLGLHDERVAVIGNALEDAIEASGFTAAVDQLAAARDHATVVAARSAVVQALPEIQGLFNASSAQLRELVATPASSS